jgi:acid phosphatase type 7
MRRFLATATCILVLAAPARADTVVMVGGDIVCPPNLPTTATACRDEQTADLVLNATPDRVLTVGDNQYDKGRIREFQNAYDKTWGQFKELTRPTPGNHEYLTENAKGYFNYFETLAGPSHRGYYSFHEEDWLLLALNSNLNLKRRKGERQMEWLRRKLTSSDAECTLAYMHHPLYSSGEHGNNSGKRPMYRLLNAAGTELILAGHDHNYERFAPINANGERRDDGFREIVVGTSGANLRPIANVKPHSKVRNADTFGVLQLTLSLDAYSWEFVPEAGETFTDSGNDTCH